MNFTVTGGTAPNWAQPAYDPSGNMTVTPQPAAPTQGYRCEYDPWNRLSRVRNPAGGVVAEYEYDGLNRRTIKRTYNQSGANNLLEARHYYYSADWQVIDERVEKAGVPLAQTPPEREYVWGLRGVDELLFRERSTANNGALDERPYALQDANFNVVACVVLKVKQEPSGRSSGAKISIRESFLVDR